MACRFFVLKGWIVMIKMLFTFVFGNALWDYLVAFFGSTQAVVEISIFLLAAIIIVKFREQVFYKALNDPLRVALYFLNANFGRF